MNFHQPINQSVRLCCTKKIIAVLKSIQNNVWAEHHLLNHFPAHGPLTVRSRTLNKPTTEGGYWHEAQVHV